MLPHKLYQPYQKHKVPLLNGDFLSLRSLHASKQRQGRSLQARQIGIGDRCEIAAGFVHAVADTISHDDVPCHAKRCDVGFRLCKCTFHSRTKTFRFDEEMAGGGTAWKRPEDTHVNIVPFDSNPLHRPAKRPQERHHSMGDQFILRRGLTERCLVPVEARQVMHLCNESLQGVGTSSSGGSSSGSAGSCMICQEVGGDCTKRSA